MTSSLTDGHEVSGRRIHFDALERSTRQALRRCGVSEEDATFVADVLVRTDAWGIHTHGVKNLAGYVKRLKDGGISPTASPRVERTGGAWGVVDGDAGLGHVGAGLAMRHAIELARTNGLGLVTLRNGGHFGAAGYYSWMAAEAGMFGLSMSNDVPTVAAPSSRLAVLGSNPIAFAFPAEGHPHVLFDISTAAVAGGKVYQAKARRQQVPLSWIIDENGHPTSDPTGFPDAGALQPAAGHKGYGLALMVEVLSGAISGAALGASVGNWMWGDPAAVTDHGAAFLAIDVGTMSGGGFSARVRGLVEELQGAEPVDPSRPVIVPGQPEWATFDRSMTDGVLLPGDVLERLEVVTELTEVTFDLL